MSATFAYLVRPGDMLRDGERGYLVTATERHNGVVVIHMLSATDSDEIVERTLTIPELRKLVSR